MGFWHETEAVAFGAKKSDTCYIFLSYSLKSQFVLFVLALEAIYYLKHYEKKLHQKIRFLADL